MSKNGDALLVIDMQQGFADRRWGRRNNPGAEARGLLVLDHWRRMKRPVVIVRHDSTAPASPLRADQPGNALISGFEPLAGETLIAKTVNSAFIGTPLEDRLRAAGITAVTVFGLTTDQCVSTTARMAANLGFKVTIVGDACACFDQTGTDGMQVSADLLHLAHLTTLNTEFGRVVTTDLVLRSQEPACAPFVS